MRQFLTGLTLAFFFTFFVHQSNAESGDDPFTIWKEQESLIWEKNQLSIPIEKYEKATEAVRQYYLEGRKETPGHPPFDDDHWSATHIDFTRAKALVVVKQYERAWKAFMAEMARQNEMGIAIIESSRNPQYFASDVYCLHATVVDQLSHLPKLPAYAGYEVMALKPRGSSHLMFVFNRRVSDRDDPQFSVPDAAPGEHRERFSIVTYVPDKGYACTSEFDLYIDSAKPRKQLDILARGHLLKVDGVARWVILDEMGVPHVHERERSTVTWEISKFGQAALSTGVIKTPARRKGSLKIVGAEAAQSLLKLHIPQVELVDVDPWHAYSDLMQDLSGSDAASGASRWRLILDNGDFARGKFSFSGKDVPVLEALTAFCEQCELEGVAEDRVIHLRPIETIDDDRRK